MVSTAVMVVSNVHSCTLLIISERIKFLVESLSSGTQFQSIRNSLYTISELSKLVSKSFTRYKMILLTLMLLNCLCICFIHLKVIYHPLYGMNNYVLIYGDWEGHMIANHPIYGGDWLSCDPLRGSHDSQLCELFRKLFKWRSTLVKSCRLMSHFIFNIFKMWYLMC